VPCIVFASSSRATIVASAAAGSLGHKLVHMWAPSPSAAEVSRCLSIWAVCQVTGLGLCTEHSSVHCSGHCIIYVMAPLVFHTYYPGWTAAFLWLAVIRTCFRVSCQGLLLCLRASNCLLVCLPAGLPACFACCVHVCLWVTRYI